MKNSPRKTALATAFFLGLSPFLALPASAADWYQPGDPTQHEIERGDTRMASGWYQPGDPTQHEIERGKSGKDDLYGTD